MRRLPCLKIVLFAVILLVLPGCGAKLKYSKTIPVGNNGTERIDFDAPLVDKATVTIKSPGVPVNVYVVLESNAADVNKALLDGKTPKDLLASKEKTQETTLEIAPGKKPFALFLTPTGKPSEVIVTATGK